MGNPDKLLEETVGFTGSILFFEYGVPGLVLGAIRNGETAVAGFAEGSGKKPDGDTMMRIGSISKVFTGATLASLVADGTVKLTDPLQKHLDWGITVPSRDGHVIRVIDLATHTSGLPREVELKSGVPTPEVYAKALAADPLLFAPGTGGLYSNFAFDVLSAALGSPAGKPSMTDCSRN